LDEGKYSNYRTLHLLKWSNKRCARGKTLSRVESWLRSVTSRLPSITCRIGLADHMPAVQWHTPQSNALNTTQSNETTKNTRWHKYKAFFGWTKMSTENKCDDDYKWPLKSFQLLQHSIIVIVIVKHQFYCASYNTCKDRWRITSNGDNSNDDKDNDNEDDNDSNKNTDKIIVTMIVSIVIFRNTISGLWEFLSNWYFRPVLK